MSQMALTHRQRYPEAFRLIQDELPLVENTAVVWNPFLQHSGLSANEARAALKLDSSTQPLIWPSDLGPAIWAQFDPEVPIRIEISTAVLNEFEKNATVEAKKFLTAKILHEMCHWGCFKKGVLDRDSAGEKFEQAAYTGELLPWYESSNGIAQPLTVAPQAAVAGSVFTDPQSRAAALIAALPTGKFIPGRNDDPLRAVFGGTDVGLATSRGYRNNNPGNIRIGDAWKGLADPGSKTNYQASEKAFCVFLEPEWGLRAMAVLLRKYKNSYNLDTPLKIISRWAPASDNNDVLSYSTQVAKNVGLDSINDFLDPTVDGTAIALMKAICRHENTGKMPYADVQFEAALLLLR